MIQNLSLDQLDLKLQEFYSIRLKRRCESLRTSVSISPNLNDLDIMEPNGISFHCRRLDEKILIGILSWYFPAEIRILVQLRLEENWGAESEEVKKVILTSKKLALGYLLVQKRYNDRDFFGNILRKETIIVFESSLKQVRRIRRSPVKPVFRRGYRDHGSLRLSHQTKSFDYKKLRTVEEQEVIEIEKEIKFLSLINEIEEKLRDIA